MTHYIVHPGARFAGAGGTIDHEPPMFGVDPGFPQPVKTDHTRWVVLAFDTPQTNPDDPDNPFATYSYKFTDLTVG